jgi:hypothetical protein
MYRAQNETHFFVCAVPQSLPINGVFLLEVKHGMCEDFPLQARLWCYALGVQEGLQRSEAVGLFKDGLARRVQAPVRVGPRPDGVQQHTSS